MTVHPDGDGGRYLLEGPAPDAEVVAALAGWCATAGRLIVELRTSGGSLEDAYLELVGGQPRTGRGRAVSRPAPLAAATLAQTGMELRLTARRGENVLVTIVIPVVVLLFFASVAILPTGSGVPGRFHPAGDPRTGGHRGQPGQPRDRDGLRTQLRGAEAARRLASDARRPVDGQDAGRPRGGDRAGRPARGDRGCGPRLASGARRVSRCSSSLPFSSARSRSAGSACSSRVRSGLRPPWPSPTACSSRSCCSAGS